MKIFVVTQVWYNCFEAERTNFIKAFTTREKAQEQVDSLIGINGVINSSTGIGPLCFINEVELEN